jgi:hypothetical protein
MMTIHRGDPGGRPRLLVRGREKMAAPPFSRLKKPERWACRRSRRWYGKRRNQRSMPEAAERGMIVALCKTKNRR